MVEKPQDAPQSLRAAIETEQARLLARAFDPLGGELIDAEFAAGYLSLIRNLAALPREHLLGLRVISDLRDAGFTRGRAMGGTVERAGSESELLLFRRLADASGYGFAVADTNGALTYANRALCRMYGLAGPADAVGQTMAAHLPEDLRGEFAARILPAALKEGQWVGELPVLSTAGSLTPTIQNLFVVHGDERGMDHVAALVLDITDRKQAELALERAKEYAENLIQTANAIVVGLDLEGRIQIFNRTAEKITGYTRGEMEGRDWFEVLAPRELYPEVWEIFLKLKAGGLPRNFENPIRTKSGEERYIAWQNGELRADGRAVGTVSFGIDITERRQAERALLESEANFRALVENAHDGILIAAGRGRHVYANAQAAEITGYSTDELCTIGFRELAHADEVERVGEYYRARLAGEALPASYETRIVRKDGVVTPVEVTAARTTWQREPADIVFVRDITLRIEALRALRESEEKYRDLVEEIDDVIYASDLEGRVTYLSPAAVRLSGYSAAETLGQHFARFIHPGDLEDQAARFARLRAGEPLGPSEWRLVRKSGEVRWVRSSTRIVIREGRPAGLRGVIVDIDARRRAEEALREFQSLYEALIEDAELGVSLVQDEKIQYVNRTIAQFVGYAPEELIGRPFAIIMPPEDVTVRSETHRRRMSGEEVPRKFRVTVRHKDGSLHALENTASVVQYRGRPAMLVVVRDLGDSDDQRSAAPR